jgi:hypothetical protein
MTFSSYGLGAEGARVDRGTLLVRPSLPAAPVAASVAEKDARQETAKSMSVHVTAVPCHPWLFSPAHAETATSVTVVIGSCETRGWEERKPRDLERIEGKWAAQLRICDRNPREPVAFAARCETASKGGDGAATRYPECSSVEIVRGPRLRHGRLGEQAEARVRLVAKIGTSMPSPRRSKDRDRTGEPSASWWVTPRSRGFGLRPNGRGRCRWARRPT